MKRLGAGPRDADDIKEHDFFKGLDWDAVFKKMYKPPTPEFRPIQHIEIPYQQIFNCANEVLNS